MSLIFSAFKILLAPHLFYLYDVNSFPFIIPDLSLRDLEDDIHQMPVYQEHTQSLQAL